MIARRLQPKLSALLDQFPAVALLGPRQVGKTTLALALSEQLGPETLYIDLELPSDRAKLSDPELYFSQHDDRLVILDEIHRLPGLFETLRGLIDRRRRKGRRARQFLLLGSASIELMQQSAETLAGRIAYEQLTPLLLSEIQDLGPKAENRLWVRGGFPQFLSRRQRGAEFSVESILYPDVPGARCSDSWTSHPRRDSPSLLADARP